MRHDIAYAYTVTRRIDCSSFSRSQVVSMQNNVPEVVLLSQLGLRRGSQSARDQPTLPMLVPELGSSKRAQTHLWAAGEAHFSPIFKDTMCQKLYAYERQYIHA